MAPGKRREPADASQEREILLLLRIVVFSPLRTGDTFLLGIFDAFELTPNDR